MAKPPTGKNFRPFAGLADLLGLEKKKSRKENKKTPGYGSCRAPGASLADPVFFGLPENVDDRELFRHATRDVVPIPGTAARKRKKRRGKKTIAADHEVRKALHALVADGKGFTVCQTPEYMEGRGYGVSPHLARRLHDGEFSIQAYIDLHGLGVQDAFFKVDGFLDEAIRSGLRAVLIIHGRGLSSPGKPVLKEKLRLWLSSGRWRKWVLAFTSARAEDGGAGATYVLLRKRPVSKSQRRGCCFVR